MAICFNCNNDEAKIYKEVKVSHSGFNIFRFLNYGSSSRTYYGKRLVCVKCSEKLTKRKSIKNIIYLFFFLIFFISLLTNIYKYSLSRTLGKDDYSIVTSSTGLNLRENPNLHSKILLIIPKNGKVFSIQFDGARCPHYIDYTNHLYVWFVFDGIVYKKDPRKLNSFIIENL